jgi:hypothetical protein
LDIAKMARPTTRTEPLVEDYLPLDVRRLARDSYLAPGAQKPFGWKLDDEFVGAVTVAAGEEHIDVIGLVGDVKSVGETVALERTPGTLGGTVTWFRCPECDRRCLILLVDSPALRCRLCIGSGLTYLSASLGKERRLQNRRWEAARRAGIDRATGTVTKPKGMRLITWERRLREYDEIERRIMGEYSIHCRRPDGLHRLAKTSSV